MKAKNLEDLYTLSPMQQGILFHTLKSPSDGVYIEQLDFTFHGDLDRRAFRGAWERTVARHTCLRTSFHWRDMEQPLQMVSKSVELPFEETDLRSRSADAVERTIRDYLDHDRDRGFDLDQVPLMRFHLCRVGDATYRFLWSFHHLILDGWSFSLVLQDFLVFYKSLYHGNDLDLGKAPPYRDYIAWLKAQDLAEAETYWRRDLAGFTQANQVAVRPAAGYRPAGRASHGRRQITLPHLAQPLQKLARRHHLTVNTLVQGAWAILLGRYTESRDILFGTTVANRPSELRGAELMVGMLISTLPLRCTVDPDAAADSWLASLQQKLADIRRFEHCPLVRVHEWSDLPSDRPLFESIVVFENVPLPEVHLAEENLEVGEYVYDGRPHYPINLVVLPGDDLPVRIIFDQHRFDPPAIERMLGHLATLLAGMVEDLDRPIGELPMLTAAETALVRPPIRDAVAPVEPLLHRRFEEQARRSESRIALIDGERRLTYGEVERRADRLARHLIAGGVVPGQRVGLLMDRCAEVVLSILAILKVGATYVPIDPAYPEQRATFVSTDAELGIVLTQASLQDRVTAAAAWIVDPDGSVAGIDTSRTLPTVPGIDLDPSSLAYLIYTSGSTGQPKGVQVSHANVCRLFDSTDAWFQFGSDDVWTLFHSYAFDFSVWEIWGALLYGGTLVVVPQTVARSPKAFHDLLSRHEVTILNQTPSAFLELMRVETADPEAPRLPIRKVIFGGEELDPRRLEPWLARYADRPDPLINMYGITETTVHVTYHPIRPEDLDAGVSPIGEPIPDLTAFVLDRDLNPVPLGVAGELYVGGAGVAAGYWRRPALTAQRFIPNPFGSSPDRLYRTGDLALYNAAGRLEFLGRIDRQIQLHGFRIELGEIESAVMGHDAVLATVVVVDEHPDRGKRLVCYVVPHASEGREHTLDGSALRRYLGHRLPSYMVPSTVVEIDHLPLTAHGKVDVRALPRPERRDDPQRPTRQAPRTDLERQLCEIWQDLLDLDAVGIEDNFFDLGGHSLLAMRLAGRLQKELSLDLDLARFFVEPTVEQTARQLSGDGPESTSPWVRLAGSPDGPDGTDDPPLVFLYPATGHVTPYLDVARELGGRRAVYGLQQPEAARLLDLEEQAELAIRHLRSRRPTGPYLLAGWSTGGVLAFETARQLVDQGESVAGLFLIDSWAPLPEIRPKVLDEHLLLGLFAHNLSAGLAQRDADSQRPRLDEDLLRSAGAQGKAALWAVAAQWNPDLDPDRLDRLFETFSGNVQAVLTYTPRPYPQPLTLFRTAERSPEQTLIDRVGPDLGWGRLAQTVGLDEVPGNHFSVLTEPHVNVLADRLSAHLAEADARSSSEPALEPASTGIATPTASRESHAESAVPSS